MRRIARWFYVLLLLAALFFGYLFNLENPQSVSVSVIGLALPPMGLGLWLLAFCMLGLFLGLTVSLLPSVNQKRRLANLRRQNQKLEQEVQILRSQSLRD